MVKKPQSPSAQAAQPDPAYSPPPPPPPPPGQPQGRSNGNGTGWVAPTPTSWPVTGDVADLLTIVQAQAKTVADQEALLHAYQLDLSAAQAVTPSTPIATGLGTSSTTTPTSLTVASVAGSIALGATVSGTGVPTGTTILTQTSGTTGGAGVYTTDQPTTATGTPMSFTPPPAQVATGTGTGNGTVLTVSGLTGSIAIGAKVAGAGVPPGTTIISQSSGTTGGAGNYITSQPTTAAAAPLAFTPVPAAPSSPWPVPQDAVTLNLLSQQQTAVLRVQNALLQHYQDVLTTSQVAAPPSGP
jgi:hypothetical protein